MLLYKRSLASLHTVLPFDTAYTHTQIYITVFVILFILTESILVLRFPISK